MNPRRGGRIRRYVLPVLTLILGLGVTATVYNTAQHNEELEHQRDFDALVSGRAQVVAKTISAYLQNALATDALFGASQFVSREEFKRFVTPLLESQTGVRAIGWVPRVRKSEVNTYLEAARADGYDFRIFPVENDAQPPAHTTRDAYPVFYIEPQEPNDAALGVDLSSEFLRADALERARHGTTDSHGATPFGARFRGCEKHDHIRAAISRQPAAQISGGVESILSGFVNLVIRLPDLLQDAVTGLDPRTVTIGLYHEDDLVAGSEVNGSDHEMTPGCASRMARTERIEMGGRDWALRFTPTPHFLSLHDPTRSRVAILAGLALTLLATAYLYISMRSTEMSRALAQSESRYRALVDNAPDAIITINVDEQRFIDVNAKACTMFGLSRDELLHSWLTEISPPVQPDGRTTTPAAREYLQQALDGETPTFTWTHTDSRGREFPCEVRLVRLVRLPGFDASVVRGSITDITERVQIEERQSLMMRELDHRVKNNLATVLSLTEQSASGAGSAEELRDSLAGRIRAIANLHSALASMQWADMMLSEIFELTFAPYNRGSDSDRIHFSGPPCTVVPDTASAICMVGHELATNAVKYGALSDGRGNVHIAWTFEAESIVIDWTESGGPPIEEPVHKGYGTRLIDGLIQHQLGGTVEIAYPESGLRCRIAVPLKISGPVTYQI